MFVEIKMPITLYEYEL